MMQPLFLLILPTLILGTNDDLSGLAMKPLDCEPAALCATNLGSPGRRVESWLESALLRQTRGKLKVVTPAKFVDLLKQSGYSDQQVREQCQDDECVAQLIGALSIEYLISSELISIGDEGFELTLRLWGSEHSLATESAGAKSIAALRNQLPQLVKVLLGAVLEPGASTDAPSSPASPPQSPERVKAQPPAKQVPTFERTVMFGFRLDPGLILRADARLFGRLGLGVAVARSFDDTTVLEGYGELAIFGRLSGGFYGGLGLVIRDWSYDGVNGQDQGNELGGGALIGYRWNSQQRWFLNGSTLLGFLFENVTTATGAEETRFRDMGAAFNLGAGIRY